VWGSVVFFYVYAQFPFRNLYHFFQIIDMYLLFTDDLFKFFNLFLKLFQLIAQIHILSLGLV